MKNFSPPFGWPFVQCDVAVLAVIATRQEFPTGFISEKCVFQDAFLNTMPTSSSDLVAIERPKTNSSIFAHTRWDVIPLDPKTVLKELKRKNPREAFWGVFELVCFVTTFLILGILNWHYICFLLPFWYFGHCLSYLNGYYRHYWGNPDEPIAWGVSTYGKLYNWMWFYNGYHAEHHFRPKVHWTRMQALRDQIVNQQRRAGVRVIKVPHALGFLDSDLPAADLRQKQRELYSEPAA
jgi:fatty acid desaturase